MRTRRAHLSLKSVYYLVFVCLIVIPLMVVLAAALLMLKRQFKCQAIETIERAQENIRTELTADINVMSMRLSHLIYTNNNEVIRYASGTDTEDIIQKYEYEQRLSQAGNLALEPVKEVISVTFYMKDGKETFIKNEIHREQEQIKETEWYQAALANSNSVCVGTFDTNDVNDLYTGGKKDLLVLAFALSPDVTTDRSQRTEMVIFYQRTGAGDIIKKYNEEYRRGKNRLGFTRIVGENGNVIFSTEDMQMPAQGYTVVTTPMAVNGSNWYIESFVETAVLMRDFSVTAAWIVGVAVFIFLLAGYYSRYFLASIVRPIEEISNGLRSVEEGNLEMHIAPRGQYEVRSMIHQFNAMVRRLRALIDEYEERVNSARVSPVDSFAKLVRGETTPAEVAGRLKEFFMDDYVLMSFLVGNYPSEKTDAEYARQLVEGFERNPRFAARCWIYMESPSCFLVFYRTSEENYLERLETMLGELQAEAKKNCGIRFAVCVGKKNSGREQFEGGLQELRKECFVRFLYKEDAVIHLAAAAGETERILAYSDAYRELAEALYVADEKVYLDEREKLFDAIGTYERADAELHIFAVIVAIGRRFEADNGRFSDIFQQQYDYMEKVRRLEDVRALKLWLTNYFAWIMDYSAAKLNLLEADAIVKAKHYLLRHYDEPDLSLAKVAEYVGLNEKYFTNKFTKEAGETFSSYLTGLRIQKAREMLKTTTFKVYEISEMVGYNNTEHFNRMFKKLNGISPAQYRKTM